MPPTRVFLASLGFRSVACPASTPPLGILSLAAYVRQHLEVSLRLFDQRPDRRSIDDLVREASAFEADVVGLSCITSFAHLIPAASRAIRRALPKAFVVLGGPHVSAFGAEALAGTEIDAAVVGEGEQAFKRLLECYRDPGGLAEMPGLLWRDRDRIVANPGAFPFVDDLDSLPFPAYDLLDLQDYWRVRSMAPVAPRRYLTLYSSRGCPYRCMYCHQVFGKAFRAQSAQRVVDEMEYMYKTYGVRELEFVDDIFNQDDRRVLDFAALVRERGLRPRIVFPNALRTDRLTEDTTNALVDAGLYFTCCALESGSPRIQKLMRKHLNIPRFLEGVEMLAKRKVFTHGYTMLGFPTETEEEIDRTIATACDSMLHTATFFTVIPYPKTELYDLVRKEHPEKLAGIEHENREYTGIAINLSDVPDDVFFARQRLAWRRFFLNPGRIARIVRDYPQPLTLPYYIPKFLLGLTKGMFGGRGEASSASS